MERREQEKRGKGGEGRKEKLTDLVRVGRKVIRYGVSDDLEQLFASLDTANRELVQQLNCEGTRAFCQQAAVSLRQESNATHPSGR